MAAWPPVPNPAHSTVLALRTGATAQATDAGILSASQDSHQLLQAASRLQDDRR